MNIYGNNDVQKALHWSGPADLRFIDEEEEETTTSSWSLTRKKYVFDTIIRMEAIKTATYPSFLRCL